ncbi:MAG: glycosyltransferase family 2 protein [Bacteroidia bacterium]|nr:glycosyltransferase family 2 protein [Bacteroidia bacterium]
MIKGRKVIAVLPAYNAALTLEKTYREIPREIVDEVVLVDDASNDNTIKVAKDLGIEHVIRHENNLGYGGNQKTCYNTALEHGADIVIMLHPDYQYTPKLIPAMVNIIANDLYPVVLGSRILGNGARKGGMPLIKYLANRGLTLIQNILVWQKLSEYHTGYRAYSREVLEKINYNACDNNFVFDNQVLSLIIYNNFEICEVTCPTKYFKEASSIDLYDSTIYAMGVLKVSFMHFLQRKGLAKFKIYREK